MISGKLASSSSISMTTDPLPPHRLLAGVAAALTLWFTGVALATALRAAAATGAALIDLRPGVTRMRASGADAVLRLYTNGAWLVWPAMDGGCLGNAPAPRAGTATNAIRKIAATSSPGS
jgi:hypothetical protein